MFKFVVLAQSFVASRLGAPRRQCVQEKDWGDWEWEWEIRIETYTVHVNKFTVGDVVDGLSGESARKQASEREKE